MKLSLALCALPIVTAFAPALSPITTTRLSAVSRRDALVAGSGLLFGALVRPKAGSATSNTFMNEEIVDEPSQQARSDKIDVNGAFVVSLS